MKIYKLNKNFKNYYLKRPDLITFRYEVFQGFISMEQARDAVQRLQQDPDHFLYVTFMHNIYAVSMETLKKQVVVGYDTIYLKWNEQSALYKTSELKALPFVIEHPRIRSIWKQQMIQDLKQIDGQRSLSVTGSPYLLGGQFEQNALTLLGIAFFETQIPVYQLNSVDMYFNHPPSFQDLWATGVCSTNPFKDQKVYCDYPFYTLDMYKKERNI